MAKITIEIDDTPNRQPGAGTGVTQIQTTAPSSAPDTSGVPAELAAKANAVGAHNAGAAPTLSGSPSTAAPVPFISSGASGDSKAGSASAGAAPAHLFGISQDV